MLESVDVVVNPRPEFTNLPNTATICSGTQLNFTPTSDVTGTIFTWVSGTPTEITGNTDGTGAIRDILTNTGDAIRTVTYTVTATGPGASACVAISTEDYVVTVDPTVVQTITNNSASICEGDNIDIDYDTPTENGSISVQAIYPGGVTGSVGYGALTVIGSSGTLIEALTNTTTSPQTVTYTFTASANSCSDVLESVDVVVNPIPDIGITNNLPIINSGEQTNISISTATLNGFVAIKSVTVPPGITGNSGVGTTFPDGTVLQDVLINSTNGPLTVVYEFEGRANGCFNPVTINASVTVNPAPQMTVTNNAPVLCPGFPTNIELSSITADAVIELISVTVSPDTLGGITSVGTTWNSFPATLADNLVNNTDSIQLITYEFEVSASGFIGTSTQTAVVTVNPQPQMTINNTIPIINSGTATNITINTPTQNGQVRLKSVTVPAGVTGNSAAGTLFPDGAVLADVLINGTTGSQIVSYEFEVIANGCTNPATITENVTVVPPADMTLTNNSPVICSDEITDIVLSSTTLGAVIELVGINITPDAGSVSGITAINSTWNTFPSNINDNLINSSNNTQTVEYVFEVSAGGFTNPVRQSVFIEVRPLPDIAALAPGICSNDVTNVDIWNPNSVNFTVFNWVAFNAGVVTGESDGSGNKISQQLFNVSSGLDSIVYRIYATAQSCAGDSIDVAQYVHPRNTANAGSDTTVCQGTPAITIETASIGGSASSINWAILPGPGGGTLTNETTLTPTYSPDPVDEVGTISLQLSASDTSVCPVVTDIVSITINTIPVVDAGSDQTICEGETALLADATIGGSTAMVTWTDSTGLGTFLPNANTLNATFIPDPLQTGTSVKLYITTNDPAGPCSAVVDSVNISIEQAPVVDAGLYAPVCIGDTVFLNGTIGGSATSATWSGGLGIFGNANQLDTYYVPAAIEQGSDVILALTTNDPVGVCTEVSDQTLITIHRLPLVGFSGLSATYQVDDPSVSLTGIPGGGTFSGPGVVGNTFSPAVADTGTHVVNYTYIDVNGCANFEDQTAVVFALPVGEIGNPGPYCLNEEPLGNPLPRTTKPGFIDRWSGSNVFSQAGEYYFNIGVAGVGQHTVTYTLEDVSTGAIINEPRYIIINDRPVIDFTTANNCVADTIQFLDLSVLVDSAVFNDRIIQWNWEVGQGPDIRSTSLQNPSIKFDENKPDTYNVRLSAITRYGCSSFATGSVPIGAVPDPNFIVNNLTFGQDSEFREVTTIPSVDNILPGYSDPTNAIDSIWWDFGECCPQEGTHAALNTAYHRFAEGNREYFVTMQIKTDLGCYGTEVIPVSVIQSIDTFPYFEDFEDFNSSAFRGDNPSWQLMIPNGSVIQGENRAWVTSNDSIRHNDNESSFVSLPAFDLRSLLRPMLSIDIWSNSENTRDGAALQYSYDGGNWFTLVDVNEDIATDPARQIGLNWYNEKGLVSRPGDGNIVGTQGENSSGYAWTGVDSYWKTARFPLDEIRDNQPTGASSVRFRVVFSSDQENPAGTNYDGFAFDNLEIRERERNVLFEHFDNLNNPNTEIPTINALASLFSLDLLPLQYHNNYPSPDVIYDNNSGPVDTRSSIYDISQSPRSFMDGLREYDYNESIIENYQVINRSLVDPLFDISITAVDTSLSGSRADIEITVTARDTLSQPIVVYAIPIETAINNPVVFGDHYSGPIFNVVKDMLPDGGQPFSKNWSSDMTENFVVRWDVNELSDSNIIYDTTALGVIVFIQNDINEGSREVYQALYAPLPVLQKTVITGLEDELNVKKFEDAQIFPNPMQNYFNVSLSDQITKDLDWMILDQRGVELERGAFLSGEDFFEVDIKEIPNGLHLFIVSSGSDYKTIRKIIIQR